MGANGIDSEQHQQGQPHHNNPEPSASHQAQADLDPANDISCHYSSPLHSFLVTGHMSGCVRLWDMAIKSPEQQCIRKWHTTGHRRALCVGMNSKVVVCGYNDSNLCVWDIHPDLNPTSSSYGTIHVASFLTLPPHQAGAVDTWFYGVEHVSVGDSLVACSTDYTGSILVFSIATGSLVYELSGSYQPTKMCMTDFFLVTGGRRPGSQNMAMRGQPFQHNLQTNQHSPMVRHAHHTEGTEVSEVDDMADMTGEERPPLVESEEHSGCCINVWDLRTGNRLYSLVPRMPSDCSQSLLGKSTIRNHRTGVDLVSHPHQDPLEAASTRSRLDSSTLDVMTNGSVLAGTPVTLSEPDNPHRQLRFSGASSRPTTQSYFPPQLALLDIAVTPDHSTLIVTLCERSGEGREGVYCWDFTGSRLDGYHEHGSGMPTMVLDKTDISYDHADVDISTGTESKEYFLDEKRQGDRYSPNGILENKIKEDVNNDMIMQQVDPIALRELHLARVTGKVWIGWRQ
ncbi:hypothetical protein BGZ76_001362 [Entomortierella beljakovae]|nr:hypothetical protein BGZ76_001362 [Entomortierella beljakovae]